MKVKRSCIHIGDDFCQELSDRLVERLGMPLLIQTCKNEGMTGVRELVMKTLRPIGAEESEIQSVMLEIEQRLHGYCFLPPVNLMDGASYSIYLGEEP
ncbi:MAG: hypothetical protein ACYCZF_13640 [Anaerolineae bacterium]